MYDMSVYTEAHEDHRVDRTAPATLPWTCGIVKDSSESCVSYCINSTSPSYLVTVPALCNTFMMDAYCICFRAIELVKSENCFQGSGELADCEQHAFHVLIVRTYLALSW